MVLAFRIFNMKPFGKNYLNDLSRWYFILSWMPQIIFFHFCKYMAVPQNAKLLQPVSHTCRNKILSSPFLFCYKENFWFYSSFLDLNLLSDIKYSFWKKKTVIFPQITSNVRAWLLLSVIHICKTLKERDSLDREDKWEQ